MFGIFNGIADSVENALDVGVGVLTMGEYGNLNKRSLSKMIADGIELAIIAEAYDVGIDVLNEMIEDEG